MQDGAYEAQTAFRWFVPHGRPLREQSGAEGVSLTQLSEQKTLWKRGMTCPEFRKEAVLEAWLLPWARCSE